MADEYLNKTGLSRFWDKIKTKIPDITGKADKVSNATNGNFAGLDSNGNLTDSGYKVPVVMNQTMYSDSGGSRTFSFLNAAITTTSTFDYFCNVFGVAPTNITVASGSLDVIFDTSDGVTECQVEVR